MRMFLLLAATAAALAASPAPAAETPKEPARARANLASYVSNDDYPAEAVEAGEQGTVRFRLDIGTDGLVTGCTVVGSSGSASLDSTTCRILTERARFIPATDAAGKPVPDRVASAIRWVIPQDDPVLVAEMEAAVTALIECTGARGDPRRHDAHRPAQEIADEAFAACSAEEQRVRGIVWRGPPDASGKPAPPIPLAENLHAGLVRLIQDYRKLPKR